jgi:hypothetical protein
LPASEHDIAKWLISIPGNKINMSVNNDGPFIASCTNGHIKIAKWLLSIPGNKINVHANDNQAIQMSSKNKRHEIVKWLQSLDNKSENVSQEIECEQTQIVNNVIECKTQHVKYVPKTNPDVICINLMTWFLIVVLALIAIYIYGLCCIDDH